MRNKLWGGVIVCAILSGIALAFADIPLVKAEEEAKLSAPAAVAMPATTAESTTVIQGGATVVMPAQSSYGQPVKPAENPGGPGGPEKNMPGKPGEAGKKPGEMKPGETKPDETAKPIQHPTKPPKPPKPEEFKVRPVNGRVSFNFNNQTWPDLLQWLADISDMDLDWQEMPGDYVNISTPAEKTYSVPEVRDLFNQLLLARGFTLLSHGKTLSVANVKKLDLSLVPRVTPEELKDHPPYEFVKVSFQLERMTADSADDELKPMLSPNGKLIPLKLTNRLEAVDAVVNLREIDDLLRSEQSAAGKQRSVEEFILKYVRAEEVQEQLEALLGKEKGPGMPQMPGQVSQGMTPEMMQQIQQQQEMMARHGGGAPQAASSRGSPVNVPRRSRGCLSSSIREKTASWPTRRPTKWRSSGKSWKRSTCPSAPSHR